MQVKHIATFHICFFRGERKIDAPPTLNRVNVKFSPEFSSGLYRDAHIGCLGYVLAVALDDEAMFRVLETESLPTGRGWRLMRAATRRLEVEQIINF